MTELNWTECLNYKDCWEDAVNLSPSLSIDLISSARLHFKAFFPLPSVSMGFPCGSAGKESACNVGGLGLIPGLGRSPGEGNGYPLQYSGLENPMDYTGLSDFQYANTPKLLLLIIINSLFIVVIV